MRVHAACAGLLILPALINQAPPTVLDAPALRSMVEGLGYTTKTLSTEAGKEKFEFSEENGGLTIPIGTELSPSRNYVWLTVSLGAAPADVSKHTELLKANARLQPDNFYVTSTDALRLGVAIDNRSITPTVLKRVVAKLVADVVDTKSLWQSG